MSSVFRYISFDGVTWSVDLGSSAIRLGKVSGFTELALLGAVGSSSVVVEDTTGTAGHSSDGFLPYQIFAVDETAASIQRLFAGWTMLVEDVTGPEGPTDSLRTGAQNRITINLEDANTLAGRRAMKPKASDASVNRPAETASARITWLLGTAYFSGVADNGLVHPAGSPTLTANDYSSSHPADVLNDCCTATGDNWFVYWDRTALAWSLAVFNFNTEYRYVATMGLSNVRGTFDSTTAGAGGSNVWLIEPGARLTKDPGSMATEVQYTYAKGTVDVVGSSSTYPVITQIASSTTVKTSALATTKATRYLADNANPQHRITCDAKILAAHVNDALPGQLITASFRQWPQYASPSSFRIAGRTVGQVEESDQFYAVNFQLIPATPLVATATFAIITEVDGAESNSDGGFTFPTLHFDWDGDNPHSGGPFLPKTGPISYYPVGAKPGTGWTGLQVTAAGSGDITTQFDAETVSSGTQSATAHLYVNGVSVASQTITDANGLHAWVPNFNFTASGVTVASGDIITAGVVFDHGGTGATLPASGVELKYLSFTGTTYA